jgi:DNA polymerase
MNLIYLDFETFYDAKYSLRAMTVPEYVLDEKFEMIICAVAVNDGPVMVLSEPELRKFLREQDPDATTTISHNALFDSSILAWRYNFVPKLSLDTLGMSRCLLGHELASLSLSSVAECLGIGTKGDTVLRVKGMRRDDIIAAGMMDEFVEYCRQDTELCRSIFRILLPAFPPAQLRMMDLVIRCATQPRLLVDQPKLAAHLANVRGEKTRLLLACGLEKGHLLSTEKFQAELEKRGVVVEMKDGTNGPIPAFSKTDPFMVTLEEHDDPEVQALAAARLGIRSTLEEKRAEKLLAISALPWEQPASLPIPLRYAGAHTHRLSGEWKINMQNLPRATTAGSKLRQCVVAPAGCSIVVCDLGQIEARLVAWQAGATTLLKQFANKLDPYARLAESIFGYKVDRKVQIAEGFVGKSGILGLGYGLGKDNFYIKTLQGARGQKVDLGALFTAEVAERTVKTYRKDNSEIPEFWSHLSYVLSSAFSGKSAAVQVGPVEIGEGYVTLPDGLVLQYGEPRTAKGQTSYKHPYGYRKKLWGGAFCENITQALAGQLIRDTWLRLDKLGYRAVWQVHDELIFVVPDTDLEDAKRIIHAEMVRCPKWAPDLPLSADIGSGKNYGACK